MTNFTATSPGLYDKHRYELISVEGKSFVFDDYITMRDFWWSAPEECSHVNVIDAKRSGGKGF